MKILKLKEFLKEKLNIKPVNFGDRQSDDKPEIQTNINTAGDADYTGKKLNTMATVYSNISKTLGAAAPVGDMFKPAIDTEKRFNSWKNLSEQQQLDKHKQRAVKSMTEEKVFATMYTAFRVFNNGTDFGKKIIRVYMDRLNREYKLSDADIIKIYFDKI